MSRTMLWLTIILLLGVEVSGIAVVYAKYLSRQAFSQLQTLVIECDKAETRWMRLQLEESTLASYGRVEGYARSQLGLHIPIVGEIQVLR